MGFKQLSALALAVALVACGKSGPPPISSGERYVAAADSAEAYQLGAGDKVRIAIYNEPQLGGEYLVSSDGVISMPLIGDVQVMSKTVKDAALAIQGQLANGYLRNPQVSMQVIAYRPFFILGEVRSPGQYPYSTGLTVYNAIATAEGYTPRAAKKVVFIRRFGDQYEQEYKLTPDLRVFPGDTLRIAERFF